MSSRKKKNLVYIVAFVLILVVSLIYKLLCNGFILNGTSLGDDILSTKSNVENSKVIDNSNESIEQNNQNIPDSDKENVYVYLCGEVINSGVYEVERGEILNTVVQKAGGFTSVAAIDRINLVYEISSNISIYIPNYDEIDEFDDPLLYRIQDRISWGERVMDSDNTTIYVSDELININIASKELLITLPGIGEKTADLIISYRENNPFTSIEDIKNVQGIGDQKFERIKELITV